MGKFYWLKMKNSFFDSHEVKIIERQENGKELLLLYIKLLVESVDYEGRLRFSETVPYTEEQISLLTDTDPEIVKKGFSLFQTLKLLTIEDDGTLFLEGVSSMIGSASDTEGANRVRRYRERIALQNVTDSVTKCNAPVTDSVTSCNERLEIRDKSLEIREYTERNHKERRNENVVGKTDEELNDLSEWLADQQNKRKGVYPL